MKAKRKKYTQPPTYQFILLIVFSPAVCAIIFALLLLLLFLFSFLFVSSTICLCNFLTAKFLQHELFCCVNCFIGWMVAGTSFLLKPWVEHAVCDGSQCEELYMELASFECQHNCYHFQMKYSLSSTDFHRIEFRPLHKTLR